MSKKWLNHEEWVVQQFQEKYLKKGHRNVLIHSSIIEGMLVNESGMYNFDSANKFLLCSKKIDHSEFCVFDEIRKIRNKIAHEIFKKKLSQKKIDELLDNLMKKIHEAYKISDFLNKSLFTKYSIPRILIIAFNSKS